MTKETTAADQKTLHMRSLKKKYDEEKRIQKPISFNSLTEADLKNVADKLNLSVWVKTLLGAFTHGELAMLSKDSNDTIPAILIERAIENQYFLLDEYLAAKGKKIVDINDSPKPFNNFPANIDMDVDYDGIDQDYIEYSQ